MARTFSGPVVNLGNMIPYADTYWWNAILEDEESGRVHDDYYLNKNIFKFVHYVCLNKIILIDFMHYLSM